MAVHPRTQSLLGNTHSLYRSDIEPDCGVIDGDMVNQFIELDASTQDELCAQMRVRGGNLPRTEVCRIIDIVDQKLL